jgi:hypothetical protein
VTDPIQIAEEVMDTMATPGWAHIESILEQMETDSKEGLFAQMTSRPESLTGRKALIMAGGLRFVRDFREAISDAVRPLAPTRIGRAQNGRRKPNPEEK